MNCDENWRCHTSKCCWISFVLFFVVCVVGVAQDRDRGRGLVSVEMDRGRALVSVVMDRGQGLVSVVMDRGGDL